jgi:hypothetical protein
MKKSTKGYLFKVDDRGNYIITHEAIIGRCNITKIIGKRMVKGRKTEFEEIEFVEPNKERHRCLIKRKELTPSEIISLIEFCERGVRSVQWHPYTEDLMDLSLLDDLGIEVLTYKHYYWGDKELCDVYLATKRENVTEELKEKLEQRSKEAIRECENHKNMIREQNSLPGLVWSKV